MRPGLFIATFAGLLSVLAVAIPVPGTFAPPALAAYDGQREIPECIAFLTPKSRWGAGLPARVRLLDRGLNTPTEPHGWNRAISSERRDRAGHDDAVWRRVGPDSIDIVPQYHGVVLRLHVGRPELSGRGGTAYYGSLMEAVFAADQFPVRARKAECS